MLCQNCNEKVDLKTSFEDCNTGNHICLVCINDMVKYGLVEDIEEVRFD